MALVDVNADALHSATDQLAFGGRKAIAIRCNVADENEVAAMVQQTVSSFGGLDSVRRQLFFRVNDNYFSRSATTTSFSKAESFLTVVLTGAEGKALQGCNLSADSEARPGGRALARPSC